MIVVDGRWTGRHGIARFAGEVVSRLPWTSEPPSGGGSPTSPRDVLAPWRFRLGRGDVVYSPGFNAGLTRARQVVTLHDLIHLDEPAERSKAKEAYYEAVVRPAVRRAGVVLTVSETSKARIRSWLGSSSRVEVIDVGNGCSPVFLGGTTPPSGRGRFLYVGNLKPHKNVDVLFRSLALRDGYRLTLVTADSDRAYGLAHRHGVVDRVEVRTGLPDAELAEVYRQHDAVLLPSRLEGFGLPALEAVASGRRVGYSSTCSSVAEIVSGEGVAVVSDGDAEEWALAMDRLLGDGPTRISSDPAWRDRYDWNSVARRVEDAVTSLIA